ncbi:hypothetical protein F8388_020405 [Cannabis sativa]|uniref:Transposase MuDR plant domain-containing protein n=1 Tax=Cannabis sativa TaxID=3483 RepID=A0A7J6HL02_CANSA|nr:hypothetical protein F8388_020405 [Cannabis sativa]KAF4395914.1 hypothetical protein G4B88_028084 [Cannabis sativa]
MTRIVIYVQYNGEWKDEHGSYKWSPKNKEEKDRGEKDIESCTKEIEQPLVDNYIDREFYFEENVCDIASTPRESGVNLACEFSDHLNKSTTGSSPTPNHSQEELMTENHIDPFDYPLEHSDQQNQLISEDIFSFTDGSNLAIGQEFKNKDEVKFTLNNVAMKAFFQMNAKSTKSLYVTKCIDKSCKWAVRVAKVSNSERFSIRTYCNTHTCSLISRKRKHRQASAKVVANVGNLLTANGRGKPEEVNVDIVYAFSYTDIAFSFSGFWSCFNVYS